MIELIITSGIGYGLYKLSQKLNALNRRNSKKNMQKRNAIKYKLNNKYDISILKNKVWKIRKISAINKRCYIRGLR